LRNPLHYFADFVRVCARCPPGRPCQRSSQSHPPRVPTDLSVGHHAHGLWASSPGPQHRACEGHDAGDRRGSRPCHRQRTDRRCPGRVTPPPTPSSSSTTGRHPQSISAIMVRPLVPMCLSSSTLGRASSHPPTRITSPFALCRGRPSTIPRRTFHVAGAGELRPTALAEERRTAAGPPPAVFPLISRSTASPGNPRCHDDPRPAAGVMTARMPCGWCDGSDAGARCSTPR
jgi:hypothetical protein